MELSRHSSIIWLFWAALVTVVILQYTVATTVNCGDIDYIASAFIPSRLLGPSFKLVLEEMYILGGSIKRNLQWVHSSIKEVSSQFITEVDMIIRFEVTRS